MPPDIFVPDGTAPATALGRTTDLGIGAHPDDLELDMLPAIAHCFDDPDRWFTGVVCTDGAGAVRMGRFADMSDDDLVATRRAEQIEAAKRGRYGAVVQLAHPSATVRSAQGHGALTGELVDLLASTTPTHVYTHNLADKHETHVAVAAAVVSAVRELPLHQRPFKLIGCEGWRDLDWLPDSEKVLLDVSDHVALGEDLAAVFESQIDGSKRYDLAAVGRRRANATFLSPRAGDQASELVVAMDLSPLVHNIDIDPVRFVAASIDRFRADVEREMGRWFR